MADTNGNGGGIESASARNQQFGSDARRPVGGSVVELDQNDYALKARRDSPWRGNGGRQRARQYC